MTSVATNTINGKTPTTAREANVRVKTRKTMTSLMPDDCRWPIGDPQLDGFHFCGERKQHGRPYCEAHVRSASTPSASRPRSLKRDFS